jgi:hypothetical protein
MAVVIALIAVLAIGGGGIWYLNWREAQAEQAGKKGPTPGPAANQKSPRKKAPADSARASDMTDPALTSKTTKSPADSSPAAPPTSSGPKALSDLRTGGVTFEKATGSSLVYAVGSLTNASSHERYGVRIEVALTDAGGQSAGVAKDYRPLIGPGEVWRFRALILDSRARKGAVSNITEDP